MVVSTRAAAQPVARRREAAVVVSREQVHAALPARAAPPPLLTRLSYSHARPPAWSVRSLLTHLPHYLTRHCQATGVERAFLCGMLALPEASLPELPSRAFAGFVLVVQVWRSAGSPLLVLFEPLSPGYTNTAQWTPPTHPTP